MTTKEAFNIVRYGGLGYTEKEFYEAENIIEKNLEALEILKDKLDIALYEDEKNNMYIMMLRFPEYYHNELIKISKREYELLKEVLER